MRELTDEAQAYLFLERLRWNGAPDACPHCASTGRCYFLQPMDGRSRPTRTGARSQRRIWKCATCRRQFSALTGTVLQGTRIPILTWIAIIADMTAEGVPETTAALTDRYGISSETARHVLDRWRAAATAEPVRSCLAQVEVGGSGPPT